MSLFPFSRLSPTCFGPSWAHHQGYFKLLFYATIWFMQCFVDRLRASADWFVVVHESPKHVGKRRGKGNKDRVQKVASVGNSYCNTDNSTLF
jgi:hypothetical protein